jgi:DNA polymerase II small subunit/DNA polymerase delta subunit B
LNNSIHDLKEAKKSLLEEKKRDVEFFKIDQQINQAGLAYEDIVKSFNYKNEEINKIINELESWNEKNEEQNEKD